ncbi:MAG TPA: radical SAM protein [Syntrophobacteria bacterium]|nr:radical SAM protein [Syntrophobacteria bacterium]
MPPFTVTLVSFNAAGHFSLANGYLKAYAEKDRSLRTQVGIDLVDFAVESNDARQALFYLSQRLPDVLGISCYCWNVEVSLELARLYKALAPKGVVVLGGPEVGPIAERYLQENDALDIVVRGEGEETLQQLLRHLAAGEGTLEEIQGLTYRRDRTVASNPDRPPIVNLDEIPSPYLSGVLKARDQVTYIETSRGCPYHCAYCYEGKEAPGVRLFSEKRIQREIQAVMGTPGVRSFHLVDSVFNLNKERLRRLAQLIAEVNQTDAQILTVEVIADLIDPETAELLREAKVASVETGPQTVHADTLALMRRPHRPDAFARGIRLLQEAGIQILCDLIIGLPGDNFFRFAQSIREVMALRPTTLVFSILHVLPGTELYEHAHRYGLRFDSRAPHLVIDTDTFPFGQIDQAVLMSIAVAKEYNLRLA